MKQHTVSLQLHENLVQISLNANCNYFLTL
jgi:hypothetical protein